MALPPGVRVSNGDDTVPVPLDDLAVLFRLAGAGFGAGARPAEPEECRRVLTVAAELLAANT